MRASTSMTVTAVARYWCHAHANAAYFVPAG